MNSALLFDLFWTFFKIGALTFGGGYAMLPLIQNEVVAHGWMEVEQIVNFVAVSESTPGPFAINISTYVGAEMAGVVGSLCTTLGTVLPSFIIILIVARCYEKFRKNRCVEGAMSGLKPAVIGMIASAVLSIARTVFFPGDLSASVFGTAQFWFCLGVFALMLFLALKKKLHPIVIVLLSVALGIGAGYLFGFPV